MVEVCVHKEIDKDLAAAGTYLDLRVMGGVSGSDYPKRVTAILLCDDDTSQNPATHAYANIKLTGSRNPIVYRLECGKMHELPVERVYNDHTDVNGFIVLGDE